MAWPVSQDCNEAIQNPQFCFHDGELKQGEAVANGLGLPAPQTSVAGTVLTVPMVALFLLVVYYSAVSRSHPSRFFWVLFALRSCKDSQLRPGEGRRVSWVLGSSPRAMMDRSEDTAHLLRQFRAGGEPARNRLIQHARKKVVQRTPQMLRVSC
jgi:hypothetical protein